MSTDDLISTQDVCEYLDVTPSAVSRMVARGELKPAVKAPGGRGAFLFSRTAVAKVRDDRKSRAAAKQASA